jgi:8-oxo-dGTP pyrophosphatase MutT (NUDIX family)
MTNYVIVWTQRGNSKDNVLLVLKDKPEWQKGKLNLPGGKVEDDESPLKAAVRELKEETGYDSILPVRSMGIVQDGTSMIHCVKAVIMDNDAPSPREEETQEVLWTPWYKAEQDSRLIPNLRVIIPLMMTGVSGWAIGDTYKGSGKKRHTIKISLPTREI